MVSTWQDASIIGWAMDSAIARPIVRFRADAALALARDIFIAHGACWQNAAAVAEHLVGNDCLGVPSHGLHRVVQYTDDIRSGLLRPAAVPTVRAIAPTRTQVEGGGTFGVVGAMAAVDAAADLVAALGIAFVTVRDIHCDAEGRMSSNPEALYTEPPGFLLPLGGEHHGHKGFALGLLADVAATLMSGDECDDTNGRGYNLSILAVRGDPLLAERADGLVRYLRSSAPRDPPPRRSHSGAHQAGLRRRRGRDRARGGHRAARGCSGRELRGRAARGHGDARLRSAL